MQKTLKSLLADGFVEEIAAARGDEVWEQSEEKGRRTLVITHTGLAAIGIESNTANTEPTKTRAKPTKGRTRPIG